MKTNAFLRSLRVAGDPPAVRVEIEMSGSVSIDELKDLIGHFFSLTMEPVQYRLPLDEDQLITVNRETGEVIE